MKNKIKELEKNNPKTHNFIMCFFIALGFFLSLLPFVERITLIGLFYASICLIGIGIIIFTVIYFM